MKFIFTFIMLACLVSLTSSPGHARPHRAGAQTSASTGWAWGSATPAASEHTVRSARAVRVSARRAGGGNIHSKAGASASVAPQYAAAFQALVDDLEAHGAVIKFMGGYRPGVCGQAHKHSCGAALDVCQYARSVIDQRCNLPGATAENAIALAHGLFHGAQWCNPDRGHFEAGYSAACHGSWASVSKRGFVRRAAAY